MVIGAKRLEDDDARKIDERGAYGVCGGFPQPVHAPVWKIDAQEHDRRFVDEISQRTLHLVLIILRSNHSVVEGFLHVVVRRGSRWITVCDVISFLRMKPETDARNGKFGRTQYDRLLMENTIHEAENAVAPFIQRKGK